jgi:hypothetical protein
MSGRSTSLLFLWPFEAAWKLLTLVLVVTRKDFGHNTGIRPDDCWYRAYYDNRRCRYWDSICHPGLFTDDT